MAAVLRTRRQSVRAITVRPALSFAVALLFTAACSHSTSSMSENGASPRSSESGARSSTSATSPNPDPRVGLHAGLMDAQEATWNLRVLSRTQPSAKFVGITNSDLAFTGQYAIQGSYSGYQIWDISNPSHPALKTAYYCPASQSDVSVYKNLLFVSGEGLSGRLDCSGEGVKDTVSKDRLRGVRIFDITDIANPKNVGNVQTCRGSHTHTALVDPKDPDNVYIYISGSAPVRSDKELAGCVGAAPNKDPNSALFRIEVIKVPLAHPQQAAIVSSPRIFNDLVAPASHGETKQDSMENARIAADARAHGAYTAFVFGEEKVAPDWFIKPLLDSLVKARGGSGNATHADSAALRAAFPAIVAKFVADQTGDPKAGPTQCHDITVYPAIGMAGGACEGYGLLLDIHDPVHPTRIAAVSDSNFSYWHSATFNNDGTKVLFSDEWGGGGQPKCRATDKHEWGADALFTIADGKMQFQSYYKMPAPQTKFENCVAHNGSLVPIPGRDVMIQSWYQGGISLFDWTDVAHPKEIAFFDRGPVDSTRMANGGSWSVYWYNGVMVSSEISRGLDIVELTPSAFISQNEIDAAKSVKWDYLNTQGQRKIVWPPSFALAGAYLDQLERSHGLAAGKIAADRAALKAAENSSGGARSDALTKLATQIDGDAAGSSDGAKVQKLSETVKALATAQ
jgi:hypothetical protein